MSRSVLALVAVPLSAGLLAGPIQSQDKKLEKKDPLQSFEPRSKPGAGQKFLEKFAGDWDVVKTFHPRKGEPVRATGACRQTMIHGGRFLQSEFTFISNTGKTTGLGLIGFEPETASSPAFGSTRGKRECRSARAKINSMASRSCSLVKR